MILALCTVDCHKASASRNDKRQRRIKHSTRLIASLTLATTENSTYKISKHEARKISKAADTQRIDMLEYRANARNGARRFGASFEGA